MKDAYKSVYEHINIAESPIFSSRVVCNRRYRSIRYRYSDHCPNMSEIHHVPQQPELAKLFVISSFNQMLLITSIILLFIYSANFHRKRWKWYYHAWNVPGPVAFPFIGNAYKFFGDPVQRMNGLMDILRSYPDIAKVWLGPKLVYLISKPEYIEKLINRPNVMDKDDFYDFFTDLLGNGLIASKGDIWKSHRKMMTRSFHQKILDGFVGIFDEYASIFVDTLKKSVGRIDLRQLATRCHADNICGTTMGVNMNIQTSKDTLGEISHRLVGILGRKVFMLRYRSNFIWNRSADKEAFILNAKIINDLFVAVVREKKKEYEEKKQNGSYGHIIEDGTSVERKVILDLLIENSDFTEEELRDEVCTIIVAGTDTTANATVSLLLILGLYPDVQRKVYEEVMEVLGPEKSVEPDDLPKLKYTERVIKETLRLFPVLAVISRYVSEDVDIGNYVAPEGISVVFPIIHIHRSPSYWKDPMKFDPDRFLPENVAERHPLSYMPFSAGIRNCIGWRYAMMNLATLVARTVREFKIFTEYKCLEEVEVEMHVLMEIKHGPKVWFEARP